MQPRQSMMTQGSHEHELKELKEEHDRKEGDYKSQLETLNEQIKDKKTEIQAI